jgi:hypothetical protein
MKKFTYLLFVLSILLSCVPNVDTPIQVPTSEEIKNDLLNHKVGDWTFAKLEEFNNVSILNTKIVDDLNLEMEVDLDLVDYKTGMLYKGIVTVKYKRLDLAQNDWNLHAVDGKINQMYSSSNEDEEPNTDELSDKPIEDAIDKKPWMNDSNESNSETDQKERTLKCSYCGEDFTQKYTISNALFLGNYGSWEGGADHCDPKYYVNNPGSGLLEGSRSKYCSRKCACESGEE